MISVGIAPRTFSICLNASISPPLISFDVLLLLLVFQFIGRVYPHLASFRLQKPAFPVFVGKYIFHDRHDGVYGIQMGYRCGTGGRNREHERPDAGRDSRMWLVRLFSGANGTIKKISVRISDYKYSISVLIIGETESRGEGIATTCNRILKKNGTDRVGEMCEQKTYIINRKTWKSSSWFAGPRFIGNFFKPDLPYASQAATDCVFFSYFFTSTITEFFPFSPLVLQHSRNSLEVV